MNWTLEVVVVPVSDVDRANTLYAEGLGFVVDHDTRMGETRRIVHLTPPGSGCSVVIDPHPKQMVPGSLQGLPLVVRDVRAAQVDLLERGVAVIQNVTRPGQTVGPGDDLNNVGFLFFTEPDGNSWAVQQMGRGA